MNLYFDVALKCFEKLIQTNVIRRWIATSKYNANTTDLSGKLIKTNGKTTFGKRLLSKG